MCYMCIQWTWALYSVVIPWQTNPPISQFKNPCNEFTSVWSMFVYNNGNNPNRNKCRHKMIYKWKQHKMSCDILFQVSISMLHNLPWNIYFITKPPSFFLVNLKVPLKFKRPLMYFSNQSLMSSSDYL